MMRLTRIDIGLKLSKIPVHCEGKALKGERLLCGRAPDGLAQGCEHSSCGDELVNVHRMVEVS